jgi:dephospho-CoA kinase
MQKRGMRESDARQRIAAQSPQEQKAAAAQVVIKNGGTIEDTWRQVVAGWKKSVPLPEAKPATAAKPAGPAGTFSVIRARPRDSAQIAALINRVRKNGMASPSDIMAEFGDKAFLLVRFGGKVVGVAGWQVENLVARTADIVLDPAVPPANALPSLIKEMEQSSKDLQCEASLIFATPELSVDALWRRLGYERRLPQSLGVAVWQEAAQETMKPGQTLYFKQLRQDRVLRPI